ncbi:MAG TPA: metal ABC transporter ATP-binding protein [Candidatus Nanoarchaeia archaeon]|nr:metal ABC transporter ATP-binding protein [Candidatus Nanoarchaeia archaeon]
MAAKPLISVSNLHFSYGENTILEDINVEIVEHDFIALIGPNGSGKTTLVKVLLGLLQPTSGEIFLSIPKEKIGYVPQRYTIDKTFPGTVEEILITKEGEAIKQTGIKDLLKKKFISLSGGQQQRVLIALALQGSPKLLILDEPTAGVDVQAQQAFYALLKQLNKKGITIILVTHEVGVLSSLVKKVLCINHRICCMGHPQDMPKLLKQMYGQHFIHHHEHNHPEHHPKDSTHKGGHHHD